MSHRHPHAPPERAPAPAERAPQRWWERGLPSLGDLPVTKQKPSAVEPETHKFYKGTKYPIPAQNATNRPTAPNTYTTRIHTNPRIAEDIRRTTRYRAVQWRITAIIVALPIAIVSSYYLYRREVLKEPVPVLPGDPFAEARKDEEVIREARRRVT